MARETIFIDGKKVEIPQWATETTLVNLGKAVTNLAEALGKKDQDSNAYFETALKNLRDGTTDLDETIADFAIKTSKLLKEFGTDVSGALMAAAEAAGEKIFSFAGGLLKAGAATLIGALGLNLASIKDSFTELSSSFSDLNKVGLNLAQGFGEDLSLGTKNVMNEFMNMGLSMQELTGIMTSNSFAMAANRKTFTTTAKTFAQLSKSGVDYGLTVAENNQLLAEELDFKSRMLFQGEVDAEQAAQQADKLFSTQMNYTKILGKSIEEIRKSAQDVLKGSSSALSLIALQGKAGTKTLDGLSSFASGLIASGVTEDFTAALLEAGTGIDMFANEATRQAFTTLSAAGVDIYGTMSTFRDLAQSGNLSVENAADQMSMFRDQIANISDEGMEQLRLMAAAGDAGAAQMISMAASVKQAKKSAEDLAKGVAGLSGEKAYKDLLEVDKSINEIKGAFTRFRQSIAISLLPAIKFIAKTLASPEIRGALVTAGTRISEFVTGITGQLDEVTDGMVAGSVQNIVSFISSTTDTIINILKYLKSAFSDETGEGSIASGVANFTGNIIESIFSGLWAAISKTIGSLEFWGVVASAFTAVAGGALILGLGLRMLGGTAVIKGALALGLVSGSIWLVSESLEKFTELDYGRVWMGIGTIGALALAAAGLGALLGMGPVGLAFIAGTLAIAGLGVAISQFPFNEMALMADSLVKLNNIKLGVFGNLAGEIKDLAVAIGELSVAAVGGGAEAFKALFTGERKTPVGLLADDLERLAKVSSAIPPAMTTSLGATQIIPAAAGASPVAQAAATGAAMQNSAAFVTKEQEILSDILLELKKSVTALRKLQETAQNSAT